MLTEPNGKHSPLDLLQWTFFDQEQIKQIDWPLAEVGDFGKMRLVKAKRKVAIHSKTG